MVAMVVEVNAGREGRDRVGIALDGEDGFIALGRIDAGRSFKREGFNRLALFRIEHAKLRRGVIGDEEAPRLVIVRVNGLDGGERRAQCENARVHKTVERSHCNSPYCYNVSTSG